MPGTSGATMRPAVSARRPIGSTPGVKRKVGSIHSGSPLGRGSTKVTSIALQPAHGLARLLAIVAVDPRASQVRAPGPTGLLSGTPISSGAHLATRDEP